MPSWVPESPPTHEEHASQRTRVNSVLSALLNQGCAIIYKDAAATTSARPLQSGCPWRGPGWLWGGWVPKGPGVLGTLPEKG